MVKPTSNKFNFFIPATFEKSGEMGDLKIKGIASSDVKDSDDEFLDPSGFDYAPLLEKGFFNWNHQANKEAGAIIGRPTIAKIVNGGKDFYVEGTLYKGLKQAQDVYNLAQVLENEDPDRRLGFSIEGQAVERDPINPKRIRKARITGVAITHCPKNPNTLLSIMKGEYSEPFIEEKEDDLEQETEKSMTVNTDLNPPSIEGTDIKALTKAQIYDQIFLKYTVEIEKADSIYDFAKQTSLKLFNMEHITENTLSKAFEILNSSISIVKSEEAKKPEDYDKKDELLKNKEEGQESSKEEAKEEDDDVNKAQECETMAKSLLEEGLNKGEMIDKLIEKGYSMTMCQGVVEKVIKEASANKEGGNITAFDKLGKSLVETINERIEKSEQSFGSSLQVLAEGIDTKFGALAEILKSQNIDSKTVTELVGEIKKSNEGITERLEAIEKTPIPAKSVTGLRAVEKFHKSEENTELNANTYSLSKAEDRAALTGRLFAEFEKSQQLGRPNQKIEKAIMDIEISKSISATEVPTLQSLGINVIQ